MSNSKSRKPGRTFDLSLLAVIAAVCCLALCCRGICAMCQSCGSCAEGSCSQSSDIIDTSDYIDIYTKNNLDLVKWAQNAYDSDWGYVYGTWGNRLTEELLSQKLAQYPVDAGENEQFIRKNWMGRRVTDCIGLIKGYCWYLPHTGFTYCSNGMPDTGANRLFESAEVKGEIDTIPEIPGLAVWVKGHIGVYIGDGWVIEAMSTVDGIQKTRVKERPWTHWCQIPYIEYIEYSEAEG